MLWLDFVASHVARGSNGMGSLRLSWADIDAYQRVKAFRFEGWELEAIRKADAAFMAESAKQRSRG